MFWFKWWYLPSLICWRPCLTVQPFPNILPFCPIPQGTYVTNWSPGTGARMAQSGDSAVVRPRGHRPLAAIVRWTINHKPDIWILYKECLWSNKNTIPHPMLFTPSWRSLSCSPWSACHGRQAAWGVCAGGRWRGGGRWGASPPPPRQTGPGS